MILLQRYEEHAELLCSKNLRITATVDGEPKELVVDYKPDGDTRCFGQWYLLEARKDQHVTISSPGETYEFKAKL